MATSTTSTDGDLAKARSRVQPEHEAPVRTFLIADVRGYTRFTQERGDEAAR